LGGGKDVSDPTSDGEASVLKVSGAYVSVDPVAVHEMAPNDEMWVGAAFGSDGAIVEGPVIALSQGMARGWVTSRGKDDPRRRGAEKPGEDPTCRFVLGGRKYFATTTRAKVIAPFASVITADLPEVVQPSRYDVDIVATYTHVFETSIVAEAGLTREGIESRIDESFPHLGAHRGMLVDLSWQLESFDERPGLKWRVQPKNDGPAEPLPRVSKE
jgi:hypothetical protein